MKDVHEYLTERWRRIRLEFRVELPLLRRRWRQVLLGAMFQYCHGLATQLAHRMHRPTAVPLHDVGFALLPELGIVNEWVSELIFTTLFVSFVTWTFSPFVTATKRFYTAVIYARLLMVLCVCQSLRIISFTATQLPGPNYHCRLPELTAIKAMPEHWWGHLYIQNLSTQATHGCGDLIFSSHTTFMLVGLLTYTEYGTRIIMKVIAWFLVGVVSTLIVASRKHYSVDVVIAWYVVPLVFYTMLRRWTTKRVEEKWPHRPLAGDEDTDEEQDDVAHDLKEVMVHTSSQSRSTELVPTKQQLTSPVGLANGLMAGGAPAPRPPGTTKAAAANGIYAPVASKLEGGEDDEDDGDAGYQRAAGRQLPGSASMMRPRSQQLFQPAAAALGAGTDSEREDGTPTQQRRERGVVGEAGGVGPWWLWQK